MSRSAADLPHLTATWWLLLILSCIAVPGMTSHGHEHLHGPPELSDKKRQHVDQPSTDEGPQGRHAILPPIDNHKRASSSHASSPQDDLFEHRPKSDNSHHHERISEDAKDFEWGPAKDFEDEAADEDDLDGPQVNRGDEEDDNEDPNGGRDDHDHHHNNKDKKSEHHHHRHHHECFHGDVQIDVEPSIEAARHHRRHKKALGSPTWAPIRITFAVNNLYNNSRYCTAVGQRRPDFLGGMLTCRDVDIMTDAKRDILVNIALPRAAKLISERLAVNPVPWNLPVIGQPCGNETYIPRNHSLYGVPNSDFVVYVTAGPIASNATLAFASYCQLDPGSQRPLVGRANFNPMTIAWNDDAPAGSEQDEANDRFVKTAVHEVCHALGFTSKFFPLLESPDEEHNVSPVFVSTVRGKPGNTRLRSPALMQAARRYHVCTMLEGVEIEDQGGAVTAGNHWERRMMRDELMAGIVGTSAISNFTLAFFHDLGFYMANFSAAETMAWGKNGTCGFLSAPCNLTAGGLNKEFCDPRTQSSLFCTPDRKAIGSCQMAQYSSPVPVYEQYYGKNVSGVVPLLDGCAAPEYYSNLLCNDLSNPQAGDVTQDPRLGFVFSATSRCIDTTMDFAGGGLNVDLPGRCLQVRCPGGRRVQIAVNNVWLDCPFDGSSSVKAPPAGSYFSGSLTCPAAKDICRDPVLYVDEVTTTTMTTTTTTTAPTTTSAPTTTMNTVEPTTDTPATSTNAPITTTGAPKTASPSPPPTTTRPPSPPTTTASPRTPYNLFRFNFSCTPGGGMEDAYRLVSWSNLSNAVSDDVSLLLQTTSATILGITMLPSSATIVVLVAMNDSSQTTAVQTAKLTAWNQTLATPVSAGSLATLFRSALGSHTFQASVKGICWPATWPPAPNYQNPAATVNVTLSSSVNLSNFLVALGASSHVASAVLTDVSLALGTQASFLFITHSVLFTGGTAAKIGLKVCLPDGLLVSAPVTEWISEAKSISDNNGADMAYTTAAYNVSISMTGIAVAAPPPVVTTTSAPGNPTVSPMGAGGKMSEHCVLAKYNYCGVVELCVLAVIVLIALFFVFRCHRRRRQRKEIALRLKVEADAKALAQLQTQRQKKLQHHLTNQIQYRGGAINPVEPYMIDFSVDPFAGVMSPPPPPPMMQQQRAFHQQQVVAVPLSPTIIPPPPQPGYSTGVYTTVPTVPGRLHTFQQQSLVPQTLAKHNGDTGPRHIPTRDDDLEDIL